MSFSGDFLAPVKFKLFFPVVILCYGLIGCADKEEPADKSEGRLLAEQHCTACHQLTDPNLLPKQSWEHLLTYMGFFLGVIDYSYLEGSSEWMVDIIENREEHVRTARMLPDQPVLSEEQWKKLREYFVSNAPDSALPQMSKPKVVEDTASFSVRPTQYRQNSAITSLVSIDETNGLVLVHDSGVQRLTVLNRDLDIHDSHEAPGVFLVETESRNNELHMLNIGDLFASQIGKSYGEFLYAELLGGVYLGLKILLEDLHRPSDFCFADLNNDGTEELLVSNFGDYTGNLSLFKQETGTGGFLVEPQILSAEPGIVKSEAHDFNEDGWLDIVVLFGAGRESLSIFINNGDDTFSRNIVFESHPSFGYTGLKLRDMDRDGRMDLITLNGDNGDSDPYNTLKRDQGIRIYLNKGGLQFEEAYFYPMYGAYGAEVEDFDLDGDLDIAAIAFFPDFYPENPENFVFLEQTDLLTFAPKTHPATYKGRWLTMDSGDFDGDGDKDIIIGATYLPVGMLAMPKETWLKLVKEGPALLVLENQIR